jgi:hypothetical protein
MPRLIGLYSSAPQSGKSSIASYLSTYGYRTVSFASPLKAMVRSFLTHAGYTYDQVDDLLTPAQKERVIPELGVSPRHLLQTLGTEWGRECISPDVWVKCWKRNVKYYLTSDLPVICDDVRFPNEAEAIRELGGELWLVTRPGTRRHTSHASEGSLDDFPYFDRRLTNNGTLIDLYQSVRRVIDITTPELAS